MGARGSFAGSKVAGA